jgi:type VI secretion system protein ImpM
MVALPPDARAGLFGKLPARGDFVRENLPRDFADSWDAWWQRGLAEMQSCSLDRWREAWLEAPVWRFVLPPGLCGTKGVLGLWMPSVDKAGRYFPLTIAATAQVDWAPCVGAMGCFLEEAEQAGRDALEHDLAPAELLERIQGAFVAGDAPGCPAELVAGQAAWWTDGGPRVAARIAVGQALPDGSAFAALIDDGWNQEQPTAALAGSSQTERS